LADDRRGLGEKVFNRLAKPSGRISPASAVTSEAGPDAPIEKPEAYVNAILSKRKMTKNFRARKTSATGGETGPAKGSRGPG
jgi:hypothetical protein